MDCACQEGSKTLNTGSKVIFSAGGTAPGTSPIFVMTPAELMQIAPKLLQFRATIVVENKSENFACEAVYQYTNDGCTWSAEQSVDAGLGYVSATATTAWNNTIANFTRGIRIGLRAKQTTGTNVEMGQVSLIVDFELRP